MSCTVVTAYYKFPSKHSAESYESWMQNMLSLDCPMVIFTDDENADKIRAYRGDKMLKTLIWVMPLSDCFYAQEPFLKTWEQHWKMDYERSIHNPNLYIIWNEKTMFVQKVIERNPFGSEFFCWCDIGCFRNREDMRLFTESWPATVFLEKADKNKMYFLNIEPFQDRDLEILPNSLTRPFDGKNRIGGTIFLGHKNIFEEYNKLFYKYLVLYMREGYFAGKDQNIIASIYAAHPDKFKLVKPVAGQGDPWFYLQRFFNKATA